MTAKPRTKPEGADEQAQSTQSQGQSRIPQFKTAEEESEFWDTHSTTEFEEESERVSDVRFVVRRAPTNKAITVRVDELTLAKLADQARRQGVGPSTLVRMWILERLRKPEEQSA